MPNHITNYVVIEAPQKIIRELKEKTDMENNNFDFNGIIKQPEELNDQPSPQRVYVTDPAQEMELKSLSDTYIVIENDPTRATITFDEAKNLIKNYGAMDWYGWRVKHWSTKWNAYDVKILDEEKPTAIALQFDTAWAPPTLIFDELINQGYTIHNYWIDEGDDIMHEGYGTPDDFFEYYKEVHVEYVA